MQRLTYGISLATSYGKNWSTCDFTCALVSHPDQWQWFRNETTHAYNIRKWRPMQQTAIGQSFIDQCEVVAVKTLSGHKAKDQFRDKMTVSTWTVFEIYRSAINFCGYKIMRIGQFWRLLTFMRFLIMRFYCQKDSRYMTRNLWKKQDEEKKRLA